MPYKRRSRWSREASTENSMVSNWINVKTYKLTERIFIGTNNHSIWKGEISSAFQQPPHIQLWVQQKRGRRQFFFIWDRLQITDEGCHFISELVSHFKVTWWRLLLEVPFFFSSLTHSPFFLFQVSGSFGVGLICRAACVLRRLSLFFTSEKKSLVVCRERRGITLASRSLVAQNLLSVALHDVVDLL